MKIRGLDEKEYTWTLAAKQERDVSSYHQAARELLREIYPLDSIIEELTIPGCPSGKLYLDLFVPLRKLAIEIHGEQHYSYSQFFFKDRRAYAKALGRDKDKKAFCLLNNFKFIELKYNERNQWRAQITGTADREPEQDS